MRSTMVRLGTLSLEQLPWSTQFYAAHISLAGNPTIEVTYELVSSGTGIGKISPQFSNVSVGWGLATSTSADPVSGTRTNGVFKQTIDFSPYAEGREGVFKLVYLQVEDPGIAGSVDGIPPFNPIWLHFPMDIVDGLSVGIDCPQELGINTELTITP